MKLTKKELSNIIEQGWADRRELQNARSRRASESTKKWKEKEKKSENVKRRSHYIK